MNPLEQEKISYHYLYSCQYKDILALKSILTNYPKVINVVDQKGTSGLVLAILSERETSEKEEKRKNIIETALLLMEYNIDVTLCTNTGNNALMYACIFNYIEIVKAILSSKIDEPLLYVRHLNINNDTALLWACEAGNVEIVTLLLNKGAEIIFNSEGITPFMLAAKSDSRKSNDLDNIDILPILAKNSAKLVYNKDIHGRNLVHYALFESANDNIVDKLASMTRLWTEKDAEDVSPIDILKKRGSERSWAKLVAILNVNESNQDDWIEVADAKKKKVDNKKQTTKSNKKSVSLKSDSLKSDSNTLILKPIVEPLILHTSPKVSKLKVGITEFRDLSNIDLSKMNTEASIDSAPILQESPKYTDLEPYQFDASTIALDLHVRHYLGHDINNLSSSQLEALVSFHNLALKDIESVKAATELDRNNHMMVEMNNLKYELNNLKLEYDIEFLSYFI